MLSIIAQALVGLIIVFFLVYAALEFRLVFLSRKAKRVQFAVLPAAQSSAAGLVDANSPALMPSGHAWSKVTVLLPVYNESKVIEALIASVCAMHYPQDRLQILVLDDSTDETTLLAASQVQRYAKHGFNIAVIKRNNRSNYKAGNLANGLQYSSGEFLALFDADFLPPPHFLRECIPCFEDPIIGYLQTGIGYTNAKHSFLTRFQAMMQGHQQFLTSGLSYEKLIGSLSGSSCIWRRSCIDSLGGWCGSTITEDVDIGYRAQFDQWQYVFLRHIVSLSELSESIAAIRVQRHRWGRGLIHNAFKHFSSFLASGMSPLKRMHAFSLICSSLLLAAIYILVLLSLPLAIIAHGLGFYFDLLATSFLAGVIVWLLSNAIGARESSAELMGKSIFSKLLSMLMYIAMFFPLSLYYFYAGIGLLFTKEYEFKRTPKGKDNRPEQTDLLGRRLQALEYFSFFYSALALALAIYYRSYWLIPFNVVVCLGFGIVIYYSWLERQQDATA